MGTAVLSSSLYTPLTICCSLTANERDFHRCLRISSVPSYGTGKLRLVDFFLLYFLGQLGLFQRFDLVPILTLATLHSS